MLEKYTHNNILSKYSKNDQFAIVINPTKDSASIYAKSKTDRPEKISDNIPLSELPSDLFGRRKSFPVVFNDDALFKEIVDSTQKRTVKTEILSMIYL